MRYPIVCALAVTILATSSGMVVPANAATPVSECPAVKEIMGPAGYIEIVVLDANRRGDLVGWGNGPDGGRALLWIRGEEPRVLALPDGFSRASARAINDRRDVIGEATTEEPESVTRSVVWQSEGKAWTPLLLTPASDVNQFAYTTDINNAGTVVGAVADPSGIPRAARLHRGTMTYLSPPDERTYAQAINARGDIVINSIPHEDIVKSPPSIWSPRKGTTLLESPPGITDASVSDINNAGLAIGGGIAEGGESRPVAWRGGVPYLLDIPASSGSSGTGQVNERGTIVGSLMGGVDPDGPHWGLGVWRARKGGVHLIDHTFDFLFPNAGANTHITAFTDTNQVIIVTSGDKGEGDGQRWFSFTCGLSKSILKR